MAIYVYFSDQVIEFAKAKGQTHLLEKLRKDTEDRQTTSHLDPFKKNLRKKRVAKRIRLIAQLRDIGEDTVVVGLGLFIRGGKEYKAFLRNSENYEARNYNNIVSAEVLEEWLKTKKKADPVPEKEPLAETESAFLYKMQDLMRRNAVEASSEFKIYEGEQWVEAARDPKLKHLLSRIPGVLFDIMKGEEGSHFWEVQPGYFLYYTLYGGDRNTLLLINLTHLHWPEAEAQFYRAEELLKKAVRVYPDVLLLNEDAWLRTQQSDAANLAFSPEELDVMMATKRNMVGGLQSPSTNGSELATGFPLFINGRAGSGKSTILQNLYVDYAKLWQTEGYEFSKAPLYLTYSPALAAKSVENIRDISRLGYNYQNFNDNISPADVGRHQKAVTDSVREFNTFLLELLSPTYSNRFRRDGRIGFARFARAFNDKFGNYKASERRVDADVAWYVIRTFIKGASADEDMEPEDFRELGRQRTVSDEVFDHICHEIYPWYTDLLKNIQGWDDQDLARMLIKEDLIKPEYPAIFCDEAQDFTPLELEIILRLNFYTTRRINNVFLRRVPLVFAGDPLQTLNPTGFSWNAVKSSYRDKFIHNLDPDLRFGNEDINYRELTSNYRSGKGVVQLGNSLMLLRACLADEPLPDPQVSWELDRPLVLPTYFELGEEDDKLAARMAAQPDLVFIIPCPERGEEHYVRNDRFLRAAVQFSNGKPVNVYSVARAKGLEFERVVVYGFGKDDIAELGDWQHRQPKPVTDNELRLRAEYQVNRVYVAISRAMREVFVVDTPKAITDFWRFATSLSYQQVLRRTKTPEASWRPATGYLVKGSYQDLTKKRNSVLVAANELAKQGRANRQPALLLQAELRYHALDMTAEARACGISAAELSENYALAATLHKANQSYDKATRFLWFLKDYNAIQQLAEHDSVAKMLECRLALALTSDRPQVSVDLIEGCQKILAAKKPPEPAEREGYLYAINELCKRAPFSGWKTEDYQAAFTPLQNIDNRYRVDDVAMGRVAYYAASYPIALERLKSGGAQQFREFTDARRECLVADHRANQPLNTDDASFLVEQATQGEDDELVLSVCQHNGKPELLRSYLNQHATDKFITEALTIYLDLIVATGDWATVADLLITEGHGYFHKAARKNWTQNRKAYNLKMVKLLACADKLTTAEPLHRANLLKGVQACFPQTNIGIWSDSVAPEVIGAVYERLEFHKEAITFYAEVGDNFRGETRQRAHQRQYVNQVLLAEHKLRDGNADTYAASIASAQKLAAEHSLLTEEPLTVFDVTPYLDCVSEDYAPPKQRMPADDTETDFTKIALPKKRMGGRERTLHVTEDVEKNLRGWLIAIRKNAGIIGCLNEARHQFIIHVPDQKCSSDDFTITETAEGLTLQLKPDVVMPAKLKKVVATSLPQQSVRVTFKSPGELDLTVVDDDGSERTVTIQFVAEEE